MLFLLYHNNKVNNTNFRWIRLSFLFFFLVSSGCWPFASPTTPVVASLPQLSPLSGFITSSTACSVGYLPTTPQVPYYTSATPPVTTFFQWPPHSSSQRHDLVHSPYYKIGLPAELYSSSASVANLPDFETVFTTSSS